MKNLFEITGEELRKELEEAWLKFESSCYFKMDVYGSLEDEYCDNPQLILGCECKESSYYFFRFFDVLGIPQIHWHYIDGWGEITLDRLVEKLMYIIKRYYQ